MYARARYVPLLLICSCTGIGACSYKEPANGVVVRIENPQTFGFNVKVDGLDAGEVADHGTRTVRVTPKAHRIAVEKTTVLPLIVFWHWETKSAAWDIDGKKYDSVVNARTDPPAGEKCDIRLVVNQYWTSSGWHLWLPH